MCVPFITKYIPEFTFWNDLFKKKKMNTLIIKSHLVPIVKTFCRTTSHKKIYSESFLAVIHYLNTKKRSKLQSLTEIISNNSELNDGRNQQEENNKDFILIPIHNKNIEIEKNIFCDIDEKVSTISQNESIKNNDGDFTEYYITLSTPLSLNIVEEFVDKCINEYNVFLSKKKIYIGQQYIYEYKSYEKGEYEDKYKLIYKEYVMSHNKNLATNIFMHEKEKLIQYITPFIYDSNESINKSEEKYNKCGFTFKAGLFFYGSPGCGKTSTIKAILKYTNRNGIIVDLKKVKTCDELKSIFTNTIYNKKHYSSKQLCFILEDCDASQDNFLLSRSRTITEVKADNNNDEMMNMKTLMLLASNKSDVVEISSSSDNDKVNLSCFLNILDGIVELYGVMIIMTTNYPDLIDEALIRPGRFDFKYEFKKASTKMIKDMIQFKYDLTKEDILKYPQLDQLKDGIISPAEVQSVCFKNENIDNCISELFSIIQKHH